MKKLVIIAIALLAIQTNAQEREGRRGHHPDFTPEEIAQLQTKKMTLDLDLTEAQQHQVAALNLENAKAKKAKKEKYMQMKEKHKGEKPNKDVILKMKNEMLDAQIENKKKMKQILNDKQFEKWEKHQEKKQAMRGKKKMMKRERSERKKQKPHRGHDD